MNLSMLRKRQGTEGPRKEIIGLSQSFVLFKRGVNQETKRQKLRGARRRPVDRECFRKSSLVSDWTVYCIIPTQRGVCHIGPSSWISFQIKLINIESSIF
jgi:hypothetical protein